MVLNIQLEMWIVPWYSVRFKLGKTLRNRNAPFTVNHHIVNYWCVEELRRTRFGLAVGCKMMDSFLICRMSESFENANINQEFMTPDYFHLFKIGFGIKALFLEVWQMWNALVLPHLCCCIIIGSLIIKVHEPFYFVLR